MGLQEVGSINMAQVRTVDGCCDCVNEPRGSIKCEVFLDWLRAVFHGVCEHGRMKHEVVRCQLFYVVEKL